MHGLKVTFVRPWHHMSEAVNAHDFAVVRVFKGVRESGWSVRHF